MASLTGIINNLEGKFYAEDENGNVRVLNIGDEINQGEKVFGDANNPAESILEIQTTELETFNVKGTESLVFDASTNSALLENEEVAFSQDSQWLQGDNTPPIEGEVLADASNADLPEEAAAAGQEAPASNDNGVFSFDARDGNSVDITSGLRNTTFGAAALDVPEDDTFVVNELEAVPLEPEEPEESTQNSIPVPEVALSIVETSNSEMTYKTITSEEKDILNFGSKEFQTYELGANTSAITFDIKLTGNENGNGQSQANGKIEFYDDGQLVGSAVLVNGEYTYTNDVDFDSVKVIHEGTINGGENTDQNSNGGQQGSAANGTSAIHINGYSASVEDGKEVVSYSYTVTVDTNSAYTMDGLPGDAVKNGDEYTFTSDERLNDTSNITATISNEEVTVVANEDGIVSIEATGTEEAYDTLILSSNQDIDFSSIGDVIDSIEEIDLNVAGENVIANLTLNDVVEMTDLNNEIKISGTSEDKVQFSGTGDWTTDGVVDTDGYKEYVNSDDDTVKVKIEADVVVDGLS